MHAKYVCMRVLVCLACFACFAYVLNVCLAPVRSVLAFGVISVCARVPVCVRVISGH